MLYRWGNALPQLGKDVYVAPNATVLGQVTLGDSSSVWFGTVVRGDVGIIRVGARSNIQNKSVVHVTDGKPGVFIGE